MRSGVRNLFWKNEIGLQGGLTNKELDVFEILDGLLYLLFSILSHPLNIT
jgi:hypothetical protein